MVLEGVRGKGHVCVTGMGKDVGGGDGKCESKKG